MTETKKKKFLKIINVYNNIVKSAGEYGPHLGKEYYVQNTIHECKNQNISGVSRATVYRALRFEKELTKEKPFILNEEYR